MKRKIVTFFSAILCMLVCFACGRQETYEIEIQIPAGSTAEYVFSEEEISPLGKTITVSAGAGIADTAVWLKPVEVKEENAYEPTYLTQGMPVKLDVEKGAWFKIGVAVQNDSEKGPIAVSVKVKGVEVRIADTAEERQKP